jgi:hypothetical protein
VVISFAEYVIAHKAGYSLARYDSIHVLFQAIVIVELIGTQIMAAFLMIFQYQLPCEY